VNIEGRIWWDDWFRVLLTQDVKNRAFGFGLFIIWLIKPPAVLGIGSWLHAVLTASLMTTELNFLPYD